MDGRVKSWDYEPVLGYFTEVQLNPESPWSKEYFTPQHLFALWSLGAASQSRTAA
ncbi:MAG: hypothetical protein HY820_30555 [Acidobacteria bacterium]|nr:hypothetical protein [Acidobacteriota bacterium]